MNQTEFFELLTAKPRYLPMYGQSHWELPSNRYRTDGVKSKVYDIANIGTLLSKLTHIECSIRFAVNRDKVLRFGEVGPAEGLVATHDEICQDGYDRDEILGLAAGVFVFDIVDGVCELKSVSHESGYFRPELKSLIWPLKQMLTLGNRMGFTCANELSIDFYNEGTEAFESFSVNTTELKNLLDGLTLSAEDPIHGFDDVYHTFPGKRVQRQTGRSNSYADLMAFEQENTLVNSSKGVGTAMKAMSGVRGVSQGTPSGASSSSSVAQSMSHHGSPVFSQVPLAIPGLKRNAITTQLGNEDQIQYGFGYESGYESPTL